MMQQLNKEDIKQNLPEWTKYYNQLGSIISQIQEEKRDDELDKEYEQYDGESKEQIMNRITDHREWIFESVDCEITVSEIDCLADDCWYRGNLDRLGSYKGEYRLKGTEYRLCEVCYDNSHFGEIYDSMQDFL